VSLATPWRAAACLVALGATFALPAAAADVLHTEVSHRAGRYTVVFEFQVAADAGAVYRRLTDYDRLDRLSRVVQHSERLPPGDDGRPRVRVVLESCVLFFCRRVRKLESVTEYPETRLLAEADPAESDYRHSRVEWRIEARDGQTRVSYLSEQEPAFFVPPLIGPWIISSRIRSELALMAERLEQLANAAPGDVP
jgi:hypothetical protein